MLMGEYSHTLDQKGRVNFPAKLREGLGDAFVLTKGLDNCLFVYSQDEWEILSKRTSELPLNKSRSLQRFFFAGAAEVEVDKQGRIIIPQHLREYADLEKDITIIGASTRAEIWNADRWAESLDGLTPDAIADAMEELGF